MMQLNEKYKVRCTDLTHEGLGVCKIEQFPIFVPNVLVDEFVEIEIIKLEKNYGRGKLIQTLKASTDRVKPICPIFGICGGCELMHLSYEKQLEFKKQMAIQTFARIGHLKDLNVKEIIGMEEPYFYRNKVQIAYQEQNKKVVCGFYKKGTHEVIPFEECYIQPKLANDIAKFIRNVANEYKVPIYDEKTKKGILRHVIIKNNVNEEYMVALVTKVVEVPSLDLIVEKLTRRYPSVVSIIQNINPKDTNVILGYENKLLYGNDILIEKLCGLSFNMSLPSFFQINHIQAEKLYQKVLEYAKLDHRKIVIDAYCGVGSISLLLAQQAKHVYGIEIVEEAIKNAKENAVLNNLQNIDFLVGKSEVEINKLTNQPIDVIVVDPPRKGCDIELLKTIMNQKINRMIYVSCDVATLARDLEILNEVYEIKEITLVDMFPHSADVESCVLLELK